MNSVLGGYDMALSLSENTINFYLKILQDDDGLVRSHWNFLSSTDGSKHKLCDTKAEVDAFWDAYTDRIENGGDLTDYEGYDLGLAADSKVPKIKVLPGGQDEVELTISFARVLLYHLQGGQLEKHRLRDISYTFRVRISKMSATSDQSVLEIRSGEVRKVSLRDKGINDEDFDIESIFLDVVNVVMFDAAKSNLPEDEEVSNLLLTAVRNYLLQMSAQEAPYILGHSAKPKNRGEGDGALLQPTGLSCSTSYSEGQRGSAINYMMLLEHHGLPTGPSAGHLPGTFLDDYQVDATADGVFAIEEAEFVSLYGQQISRCLKEGIFASFGKFFVPVADISSGMDITISFKTDPVLVSFDRFLTDFYVSAAALSLKFLGIENKGQGITLSYQTSCEGLMSNDSSISKHEAHVKLRCPDEKKGLLKVTLMPGDSGRILLEGFVEKEFSVQMAPPPDGSPWQRGKWDEWLKKYGFHSINEWERSIPDRFTLGGYAYPPPMFLQSQHDVDNMYNHYFDETLYRIDDFLAEMSFEHLAGQVILPVSSEFFYKNIRYHEGATPEDNLISLDISYKTES